MNSRTASPDAPLNIYEMHLGSWMRNPDDANGWYTYDEIARRLIPYLQENGYTHVEFLPLSEHPFDGSWGYQNTGFFAPTSRYGTPAQLKMLIDKLHHAGIGAIMDFVPVHFAVDSYGLAKYDGTHLYEYPHSAVGESEWGSYNFIHSRREVRCFLQSAADYWLTEFHFDGLRMDAVSRLIYWQGDPARGVNGDTLEFLKNMNRGLKARHPSALLIAEDSTAYPGVTRPGGRGRLGLRLQVGLGWMHRTRSNSAKPSRICVRATMASCSGRCTIFPTSTTCCRSRTTRLCTARRQSCRKCGAADECRQVCAGACDVPLYVHASG